MRGDILALGAFLLLGALLALPFLGDEIALVPFHTGTVAPWSANAPEWVKDEPVNYNVGDKHAIIHPDVAFTREQIAHARMPLWNPHNFAGIPHQANPLTAVTYPPNAIFNWVDPITGFALLNAFHVMLAGLFTFFLCRTLDIGAGASFVGGLAFALSGWMAVHTHHSYFVNTLTWLPLALGSVERILRMRSRWALMTLAISIGMMFLAGFPQTAMIGIWFLIAWTIVGVIRLLMSDGYVIAGRRGGLVAAFAVLGVMAGGIQLLPAVDFMREVGHQDLTTEQLAADALRPAALGHLLAP